MDRIIQFNQNLAQRFHPLSHLTPTVKLPGRIDYRTGLSTDDPGHADQLKAYEKMADNLSRRSKLYPWLTDK